MAGNEAVVKSPHHCNKEVEKSDELDVNDSSSSMAATLFFHILRTFETIPSVIWSESLTVGRKEKKSINEYAISVTLTLGVEKLA